MNNTQQVRALQAVVDRFTDARREALLGSIIAFVYENARNGCADFPLEEFADVIFDE